MIILTQGTISKLIQGEASKMWTFFVDGVEIRSRFRPMRTSKHVSQRLLDSEPQEHLEWLESRMREEYNIPSTFEPRITQDESSFTKTIKFEWEEIEIFC